MAHTLDTWGTSSTLVSANPITASANLSAGTTVLVVGVVVGGNTERVKTSDPPTYDGVPMSGSGTVKYTGTAEANIEVWYLLTPPTGSAKQISVPNPATSKSIRLHWASFKAPAGRSSRLNAYTGTQGFGTAMPGNITSSLASAIFGVIGYGGASVPTGSQTVLATKDEGAWGNGSQYVLQSGAGAVNAGWTYGGSGDDYATIAIAFDEGAVLISADPGSFTQSGQDVTLKAGRVLSAGYGAFTLNGQDVTLTKGESGPTRTVTAEYGSFTLSGKDATLTPSRLVSAGQGSFTLSGQDVTLKAGRVLSAGYGAFTLSGQGVTLTPSRLISAGQGTISLNGQDVTLSKAVTLSAGQGSFTLTGQDVTLTQGQPGRKTLTAERGTFTLSGQDVSLLANRSFVTENGSLVLEGQAITPRVMRRIGSDQGSFTLSGQDVTLTFAGQKDKVFPIGAGSFTLSGKNVILFADKARFRAPGIYANLYRDAKGGVAYSFSKVFKWTKSRYSKV